jgi:hypothetical protein
MEKYLYQGEIIEYSGFMMDGKYCFYFDNYKRMLYLSKSRIETLEKLN